MNILLYKNSPVSFGIYYKRYIEKDSKGKEFLASNYSRLLEMNLF